MSSPVFIVGPARSGTTLTRNLLNLTEELWIADETHWFDDLRPRLGSRATQALGRDDMRRCEDYFLGLASRRYGSGAATGEPALTRDELRDEAVRLSRTGDAVFEAYCRLAARRQGRARWGEKTPRHVFRITEILQCFPNAQILVVVRDPRATVSSYRDFTAGKRRNAIASGEDLETLAPELRRLQRSYHPVVLALMWRAAIGAALAAHARFGASTVRILRFEDLLVDPEREMDSVARWLGLNAAPDVTRVAIANSSYVATRSGVGVIAGTRERWRGRVTRREVALIETLCNRGMATFQYPGESSRAQRSVAIGTAATAAPAVVRALVVNRGRRENAASYVTRRLAPAMPSIARRRVR